VGNFTLLLLETYFGKVDYNVGYIDSLPQSTSTAIPQFEFFFLKFMVDIPDAQRYRLLFFHVLRWYKYIHKK